MGKIYYVVGHLTPTDATPEEVWGDSQGKLDKDIDILILNTKKEVESALLWYTDGIVIEREENAQGSQKASQG